jgi:asparagine synthase (glutamine-hydrolysing)
MCGIAGVVGHSNSASAAEAVAAMQRSLAHRGPNDEGTHGWEGAVLGHRRLSIFDLSSAGHQPMISADGAVGLVFNGAIYNFPALRDELRREGFRFVSDTDTEVLLHGYAAWGIDLLVSRLIGMFAFGIWDDRTKTLTLVRDRLGVKPLLYAERGGALAFASTARALRAGGFASDLDEHGIAEFLEFGFVTDDRTVYRAARKVPAASIVEWRDGRLRSRVYWRPPAAASSGGPSFGEAVEEAERLLLVAVERRLHADVPVGALLSGGIDSALVCWAIAKLGGDVTAFTVGTPGDPWDESSDAVATAKALGLRHELLPMTADEGSQVDDLVTAYGEPFACASALGMLRVSQAVASSATVLLTGDGGDDVFLGYPRHRHLWMAEKIARATPPGTDRLWRGVRPAVPKRGPAKRLAHFADYVTGGLGAFVAVHDGLPYYEARGILGDRLREVGVDQRSIPPSRASARRVLSDYLEYDRRTQFVAEYLTKVDGATMYHALEARSPFLDTELWEFAAALPYDLRLRGGKLKAVLREVARRRIGRQVARGQKRGFQIPVQRWLAGRWRGSFEGMVRDSLLVEEGWIRKEPVLAAIETASRGNWAPHQLWYLYVLESWLRREKEASPAREAARVG